MRYFIYSVTTTEGGTFWSYPGSRFAILMSTQRFYLNKNKNKIMKLFHCYVWQYHFKSRGRAKYITCNCCRKYSFLKFAFHQICIYFLHTNLFVPMIKTCMYLCNNNIIVLGVCFELFCHVKFVTQYCRLDKKRT